MRNNNIGGIMGIYTLKRLLNNSGLYVVTQNGKILDSNQSTAALLNCNIKSFIGLSAFDIVIQNDHIKLIKQMLSKNTKSLELNCKKNKRNSFKISLKPHYFELSGETYCLSTIRRLKNEGRY